MSNNIAQNLQRLNTDKNNICDALITKGVIDAQDHGFDDFAEDILSIDNQYTLEDEGKVVSNGQLTSQTSLNITENGEYNTTLNNSISVNVSNTPNPVSLSLHCVPTSNKYTFNKQHWTRITWTGCKPEGTYIWTDGTNIYYSNGSDQYVLIEGTKTWEVKTWTGLSYAMGGLYGNNIWSDGDNIYYSASYSYAGNTRYANYMLNKDTSAWSSKSWVGLTQFLGENIWTDGINIYYSYQNTHYILNKETSTWETKTWLFPTTYTTFRPNCLWTDGNDIYYTCYLSSSNVVSYVLNKVTSTWENKRWSVVGVGSTFSYIVGKYTDGDNIYGFSSYQPETYGTYVLDKVNSTWYQLGFEGGSQNGNAYNRMWVHNVWTDGTNIYGTVSDLSYYYYPVMLVRESNSTVTTNTTFPVLR